MHIVILLSNDISYDQRMLKTARTLENNGFEVTFIGRKKNRMNENDVFKTHRFDLYFNKGKLFYIELQIRMIWYLLFKNFDKILAVDIDTSIAAFVISKLKNKPYILDCHELFPEVPELHNRIFSKKIWELIEKVALKNASKVYTVSQSISDFYINKYKINCDVIYNMPLKIKETSIKNNDNKKKVILYQGDLNEGRGLEAMIQIMPQIDAEFWIIGDGLLYQKLKNLITTLQIEHKVFLKGVVLPEQLAKITLQADIGINLLENKGLSYYFSLANKFFDYVQSEIPSLNMNFPEYKYFLSQHQVGLTIDNLEPKNLIETINVLFSAIENKNFNDAIQNAKKEWIWENQEPRLIQNF
jgi:glycosyltransferase involved in cell wall biosynthesis